MKTFECGHCGGVCEITGLVNDIREFHEKFNRDYKGPPRMLPEVEHDFRLKAMNEEITEYVDAKQMADKLDALVDLVYFAMGAAYMHGFDFNTAWRRVHGANMRKVLSCVDFPSKRGKNFNGIDIVKPPGWTAPDLRDLVRVPGETNSETFACLNGPDANAKERKRG